jgi:hypothetical protein
LILKANAKASLLSHLSSLPSNLQLDSFFKLLWTSPFKKWFWSITNFHSQNAVSNFNQAIMNLHPALWALPHTHFIFRFLIYQTEVLLLGISVSFVKKMIAKVVICVIVVIVVIAVIVVIVVIVVINVMFLCFIIWSLVLNLIYSRKLKFYYTSNAKLSYLNNHAICFCLIIE